MGRPHDAPLMHRPMTWSAWLGITGCAALFVAFILWTEQRKALPHEKSALHWKFALSGAAALAVAAGAGIARAMRRDRELDALGFLFPELEVFEGDGVHVQVLGLAGRDAGREAAFLHVLIQNCHRDTRHAEVSLTPLQADHGVARPDTLRFGVRLGPAQTAIVLARRGLSGPIKRATFDLALSVRCDSPGPRVRFRRGYGLRTQRSRAMEALAAVAHGHVPGQAGEPCVIEWTDGPMGFPVPGDSDWEVVDIVWRPPGVWCATGAVREWLRRVSRPFASAAAP